MRDFIWSAAECPVYKRPLLPSINSAPLIYTSRLLLRPLLATDSDSFHELITDAVTQYWIGWETPSNRSAVDNYVTTLLKRTEEGLYRSWVAVQEFDEQKIIGCVALDGLPMPFHGAWFELDCWVGKTFWGQGYATEMASAILDWTAAYTSLDLITISWTAGNVGSQRAVQKLLPNSKPLILPATKNGHTVDVHHYLIRFHPKSKSL
jgi:[ribosomal protein S5]-alanine N-acetyltransferase